jgi:DNA-binding MarR family transcriptional regulator
MIGSGFEMFRPTQACRELEVLREIGRSSSVSQRGLARVAGVSATMVNAYIDDLVGRGLLEVHGETNRSYRYHLTPAGLERLDALQRRLQQEVFELGASLRRELRLDEPLPPQARSA